MAQRLNQNQRSLNQRSLREQSSKEDNLFDNPRFLPLPPPKKTKLNWLVIYDNSTESTFKGKSASIEALTKTTLSFNYGFVVNASNIDQADNRNRVIHELNLKAPERGHINLLQSHQAIHKRHKELRKQRLNAFVYIGYDSLATKDSKLDKFNPLLEHAKQRVYLILDEEGRCLRSKAPHQDPSKFSSSERRKVSCLKPSQIIRYLDRLPNEL